MTTYTYFFSFSFFFHFQDEKKTNRIRERLQSSNQSHGVLRLASDPNSSFQCHQMKRLRSKYQADFGLRKIEEEGDKISHLKR
ncbi:Protein CBG27890 [Caenorhabditis briggsae]|uniref:Protein CBG27890 n=1 Tax=Caenorhabditis briggsae TaxID=6238 RepID=B6IEI5_CAEBR|nr:Protein CBG27890 [Caenorhabditis briggsae]CAR98315.1 Protein CBG27890 [Caenorhabditis briggsae]